ncbi:ribonuclease H-like domain-containing protein, partial [Tanacetum coccineum]
ATLFVPGENVNIFDFSSGNNENDAQSSDDTFPAQNEQVAKLEENVIYEEIDLLLRNDTWEITELPKDRKAIGSKLILKIKYKSNGESDRYKARLLTKGFNQKEWIDYEKTFSPMVKMVTIRCLLNLDVLNSWHAFQLDVNNAFLYGDLVKTVYMKPHDGYFPANDIRVQSKSDYSLYTKSDKGVFVALLVYVDDIIIISNSLYEIEKFKTFLKSKFMIKDLGKLCRIPINTS